MIQSRCGICCNICSYQESHGCKGCTEISEVFWGKCDIKSCCEAYGYTHCGQCRKFPCDVLIGFSYADNEHGDNGRRIEQCRAWHAKEN